MAYIQQRGKFWRVEINRKGHAPQYRTCDTKREAETWAKLTEAEMKSSVFIDTKLASKLTLEKALEKYREKIVSLKAHPYQENKRIDRWISNDLSYKTLANLRAIDFARYRDQRRASGKAENTIRLELSIISHLFEIARKEWDMSGLVNPIKDIQLPSGSNERERRLSREEYVTIRRGLRKSTNKFAAIAYDFAIETGLRQGLLFKLEWEWIDFKKQLITIPEKYRRIKNKGVPRHIPMSTRTIAALGKLAKHADLSKSGTPTGPLFKTTTNAVVCVWKKTLERLQIKDLRWHDLRHEATSRLFERNLGVMEVASITGHRSMQMLKRYTHLNPEHFREKLG